MTSEGTCANFDSRFWELSNLAKQEVVIGIAFNEGNEFMCDKMLKYINDFHLMQPRCSGQASQEQFNFFQVEVEEPVQCTTKGRPRGKRMKPAREKLRQKSRKCNACGMRGQEHDSRNCPTKIDRGKFVEEESSEDTSDEEEEEEEEIAAASAEAATAETLVTA